MQIGPTAGAGAATGTGFPPLSDAGSILSEAITGTDEGSEPYMDGYELDLSDAAFEG